MSFQIFGCSACSQLLSMLGALGAAAARVRALCRRALGGLVRAVRRALCCVRRRRDPQAQDSECLTHVGVVPNRSLEAEWATEWGDRVDRRPQTVQEHIQSYRDKLTTTPAPDPSDQVLDTMFQEMAPQVIRQKKVIIATENSGSAETNEPVDLSRLSAANNFSSDLGEWLDEAASGWDEQQLDAEDFIRKQKRAHRHSNKLQTTKLAA